MYELFDEKDNNKDNLRVSDWIYPDLGESIVTFHNINLGIKQMIKPSYNISVNISHCILTINGYSYQYNYGERGSDGNYKYYQTPIVKWGSKTDIKAYTREFYPSDVYFASQGGEVKAQIVYRIDISNTTNTHINGTYNEHKLVIDKDNLIIKWDYNRYILDSSINSEWHNFKNSDNYYSEEYKEAIEISEGENRTIYTTFNIKPEVINELINNPNGSIEDYPIRVEAKAYHEYTKYDYSWNPPTDSTRRNLFGYWAVDDKDSNNNKVEGREGKIHHSISDTKTDLAPPLIIGMSRFNRTISGTIFEDKNVRSLSNEVVGNGKYDNDESRISNVKIDILNSDGTYAMLYTKDQGLYYTSNPEIDGVTVKDLRSNKDGTYNISGIIPGKYYIMFTYGDGTQIIRDTDGNALYNENGSIKKVYSNGYKSTIVTDSSILKILKYGRYHGNLATDKTYLWYLDNNSNQNYNTAIDNQIDNSSFTYNQQIDYKIQNNDPDSIKGEERAKTPYISVPIELTTKKEGICTEYYWNYENMGFGIIEKPKIEVDIKKEITNVKLTLQNGQVLFEGNPAIANTAYLANLDQYWSKTGSKNTKAEIDNQYLYGSTLEIKYIITIENKSNIAYATEKYYKYGEISENENAREAEEAKIYVNSVLEYLDPLLKIKLHSDIKDEKGDTNYTYSDNKKIEIKSTTTGYKDYESARLTLAEEESNGDNSLKEKLEGKYNIVYQLGKDEAEYKIFNQELRTNKISEIGSSVSIDVVAQRILSDSNEDFDYTSFAQIEKITTAKNVYSDPTAAPIVKVSGGDSYWSSTIIKLDEIPSSSAKIAVTPSTGLDRSMKYILGLTIMLIALGGVIICIKKIKK